MQYIRALDGQPVDRNEACTAGGTVKPGYKVRVGQITDGQRVTLFDGTSLSDAAVTLTDAESALAVGQARRQHVGRHGYLGSRAPAFTDAHAASAIAQAAVRKQAATAAPAATQVRDAVTVTSRAMLDAANRQRRSVLATRWRK